MFPCPHCTDIRSVILTGLSLQYRTPLPDRSLYIGDSLSCLRCVWPKAGQSRIQYSTHSVSSSLLRYARSWGLLPCYRSSFSGINGKFQVEAASHDARLFFRQLATMYCFVKIAEIFNWSFLTDFSATHRLGNWCLGILLQQFFKCKRKLLLGTYVSPRSPELYHLEVFYTLHRIWYIPISVMSTSIDVLVGLLWVVHRRSSKYSYWNAVDIRVGRLYTALCERSIGK